MTDRPGVRFDQLTGHLIGERVTVSERRLAGMEGYFTDTAAWALADQNAVVYRVEAYEPVPEGVLGGIGLATTYLFPGSIGGEYYMTRGHFHSNADGPELCMTISGSGALILMSRDRETRYEMMSLGSVHHVPSETAHKAANIGTDALVFVSYWSSEIGHDYETIKKSGFSRRLISVNGIAELR